jgi:DMSO reductase anchor subunit
LDGKYVGRILLRFLLLSAGLMILSLAQSRWTAVPIALALIAGEFVSRYLFFVSVVPTNIATEYLAVEVA